MSNLLICQNCHGIGKVGLGKCKHCNGRGAGFFVDDYFLYWGGTKSSQEAKIEKIKRLVDKIIDGFLIIFGLYGFLNLFFALKDSGFLNIFTYNFWLKSDPRLFIFFLAGLGFLYFGMRSTKRAHRFEKAIKISYSDKLEIIPPLKSENIATRKQIDVAKSFSENSRRAIECAFSLAKKNKKNIEAEEILLSLLKFPKIKIIFGRLGVPVKKIKEYALRNIAKGEKKHIELSESAYEILLNSYIGAAHREKTNVGVNLLLKHTIEKSKFLQEAFYDLNITEDKLENVISWIDILDALRERYLAFKKASIFRPRGEVDRAMTALQTLVLDRFSEDLTYAAKRGAVDLCIGREDVFENIFRILKSGKRGVVLVGERGVGKSAIIDGIAELMIKEDVPKGLQDKRLVRLSLPEILGGATKEEAGKNLMQAIGDAERAGNIVLEIPNLEYFMGGEGMSLASLLAEELLKLRAPVIASTTPEGYSKVVEGTVLANIFEEVEVSEPDENLAIQILESESALIEYEKQVYFSYDALLNAVKLSDKYLHERFLPEKAMEIIKETSESVLEKRGKGALITGEDVAVIISEKSKVPISSLTENEKEKLLKLEEEIGMRIVGQKEAVESVSRALRRARAGMHKGERPIASFLFLGPTGVGKTELTKTLSHVYFGSEEAMSRFDMSEFQNKESIRRLIGGKGEAGALTDAVRKKPFALLLLDEIEKAHPDILNLFLQVMEDGRLTDGKGRTADFTNIILVATSNAGSNFIASEIKRGTKVPQIQERLVSEKLEEIFRPEFLNRFDGVIVFEPLKLEEIVKIAGLLVKGVAKKIEGRGVELVVEEGALRELARLGYDPKFGARPLRRVIAREIEDKLANMLLRGELKRRDKVVFQSLRHPAKILQGAKFYAGSREKGKKL